jgi:lipoprotein-anchoring transpeptidase ErfK/SrfK
MRRRVGSALAALALLGASPAAQAHAAPAAPSKGGAAIAATGQAGAANAAAAVPAGAGAVGAVPAGAGSADAAEAAGPTARSAWTGRVVRAVAARAEPGAGRIVDLVDTATPFWGGPNRLLVLGRATRDGRAYLRVLLKRYPADTRGWIPADAVRLTRTDRRIVIDLSERTLTVFVAGHARLRTPVVVGAPATPTPTGLFAVDAVANQPAAKHLGPHVLALVAYSRALRRYQDATPQVALHGYEELGAPLGTAASHGCIRLPSATVAAIAKLVPSGAPVRIQR